MPLILKKAKGYKVHRAGPSSKLKRKVAKLAKTVGNPEYKNFTLVSVANMIPQQNTNGVLMTHISNIPVGQGGSSRIGDKVAVKSIDFSYSIQDGPTQNNWIRYVIFVDDQYDSVAANNPALADILDSSSAVNFSQYNAVSPYNNDMVSTKNFNKGGRRRYRILYDKLIMTAVNTVTEKGRASKKRLVFKTPIQLQFNGADTRGGQSLWVMHCPGYSTTAGNNPFSVFRTDVRYTDM